MKITDYSPRSGRMIKEDGTVVNIADILAGDAEAVSESTYNKEKLFSPPSAMVGQYFEVATE